MILNLLLKGLIFTILSLSLALLAYAQDDEDILADVGNDITVDFAVLPSGVYVPPSFQIAGMTFFSHGGTDPDSAQPHIADWPLLGRSYVFPDEGITVVLPLEAERVELALCVGPSDVTIEVLSSVGSSLSRQLIAVGVCDNVSISSSSSEQISVVRLTGGSYESSIAWLSAILSSVPRGGLASGSVGLAASGGAGFASFSAGHYHACWVQSTGTVDCWGSSRHDLGQFSPPPGTFTSVSAGGNRTCGVRPSGAVECWGHDPYDQFSPPPGTFTSVSAGGNHQCGIRPSGVVECWGPNLLGQSNSPAGIFISVSAGGNYNCGIHPSGAVACWGQGYDNGYFSPPPETDTFTSVSAGRSHTCGVRSIGIVECWGDNHRGQSDPPAGIFTSVSAGYWHTCGVRPSGAVECWGDDRYGQSSQPAGIFTFVSAGGVGHTCGKRLSGAVECWGASATSYENE